MSDALTEAAMAHIKGLEALRDNNASLSKELSECQHNLADAGVELKLLRKQVEDLTHERDFYLRYNTELVVKLNTVTSIINETLNQASQEAYKPMVHSPATPATPLINPKEIENVVQSAVGQ